MTSGHVSLYRISYRNLCKDGDNKGFCPLVTKAAKRTEMTAWIKRDTLFNKLPKSLFKFSFELLTGA